MVIGKTAYYLPWFMYTKKDDNDIKQMAQNRKKGCAISALKRKKGNSHPGYLELGKEH